MSVATPVQAERLGEVIRFRTTTVPPDAVATPTSHEAFRALNQRLRVIFPRVARGLAWEETPDGALLLTWSPAAATGELPILFCVHSDVVPVGDVTMWTHPPFSGAVADGQIWGRGCLDDKGMLVALLESLEDLLARGVAPRRTVYVAVGCDEETEGRRGAATLAALLESRGVRLAAVLDEGSLILDRILPTVGRPVAPVGVAEKGYLDLEITVRGPGGHSALPGRTTAAGVLAAALARLESRPSRLRLTPVVAAFFVALGRVTPGPLGLALRGVRLLWPIARHPLAKERSIAALLRTTRAVTVTRAGEAPNVIPTAARAVVNLRLLPGDTVPAALGSVRRLLARRLAAGFTLTVEPFGMSRACEAVGACPASGEVWEALRRALEAVCPGVVVAPFLTPGLTDSRAYARIADAIYRVVPVRSTREGLGLIHGVDERISLEDYGRMIACYTGLIRELAG